MSKMEPVDFVIRPYRDEDFGDLIVNISQGGILDQVNDTKESFRRKTELEPASILVASTREHGVIGNVFVTYDGWSAFIFRLAVREFFRGRTSEFGGSSLGVHLMRAAETSLIKRGATNVCLLVHDEATPLKAWYQSQGYGSGTLFDAMQKPLA